MRLGSGSGAVGIAFILGLMAVNAAALERSDVEADWARQEEKMQPGPNATLQARTAVVVSRGVRLAERLQELGVQTGADLKVLKALGEKAAPSGESLQEVDYLRARWTVREMALRNPLLNFDSILFTKRAPSMFPHMSDQHYGWWSRPGGGIFILQGFRDSGGKLRQLTSAFPPGSFTGPELSYDGTKILFSYAKFHPGLSDERNKADKSRVPEDAFFHVYEVGTDGSGCRQLTRGRYDDFDACWLPTGDIVFLSTRKGQAIQCTDWFSNSTRDQDLPDSYVRCGGDNYRPVPVFTLHAMKPGGEDIRPLSAFENFEWAPSVSADGRVLYTRWDYIDRFNGHFFSLWSANQDGTNPQLLYGNYTVKPQVVVEARSIPGSSKLICTAGAHHSITGGTLCLLDRSRGTEGEAPLTRLTPQARFPETEGNEGFYYAHPWPLSEDFFLAGWADAPLPPHGRFEGPENPVNAMGLYLLDSFGNMELLYRDPEISSVSPVPLVARPLPVTQSPVAKREAPNEGQFLVQDVYSGLPGIPRGSVKQLRLIGVPPKVQPHMNTPSIGVSAEDPGKFVLGTVPVEPDGSAFFRMPSGIPVFFQALDEQGAAVQTMRTLTYVMPGQTLSCVGCHEHRDSAPLTRSVLAARGQASNITPGPEGSWPLSFARLVQPVLDKYCVTCHQSDSGKVEAAKLDLSPGRSYESLLGFGNLRKEAFERDRSTVNEAVAANSALWRLLAGKHGHQDLDLDSEARERLLIWLDTYAQRQGHYSDQQERELSELRKTLSASFQSGFPQP